MNDWFENDDGCWRLKRGRTLLDLSTSCYSFLEFQAWLSDAENNIGYVFVDDDCAIASSSSLCPFDSALTLLVKVKEASENTLLLSGRGVESMDGATKLMLDWLSVDKEALLFDVTIKAFATQPRQSLPPLGKVSGLGCLRFHFLDIAVPLEQIEVDELEFRQCTTSNMQQIGKNYLSTKRMSVSCSQPELLKLEVPPALCELHLLLHFFVTGPPLERLCQVLRNNTSVHELSIKYLDMSSDSDWALLFSCLRQHPSLEKLTLGFTDSFVDNYRRLTPERRLERTKVVLEFVEQNPTVTEVNWPEFQKDDDVAKEILACITSKNKS